MFYVFKSKASVEAAASRRAMEACEHIISEMGAELHDDLIQKLSVFRLYLDQLDRSRFNAAESEALLIKMNADFKDVVQSVRRISRQFLPVKMEGDSFQTGINILCQNMERPGGSTIHFKPAGNERKIPALAEIYLSRIIQELIHNSLKHSSAWHITVRLTWLEYHLAIEVEDDGTGFSKVTQFIESLKKKYNTLRMRSDVIGARIAFLSGNKGLLARVEYDYGHKIRE
jgi:two-component system NarL family sensor kinase